MSTTGNSTREMHTAVRQKIRIEDHYKEKKIELESHISSRQEDVVNFEKIYENHLSTFENLIKTAQKGFFHIHEKMYGIGSPEREHSPHENKKKIEEETDTWKMYNATKREIEDRIIRNANIAIQAITRAYDEIIDNLKYSQGFTTL